MLILSELQGKSLDQCVGRGCAAGCMLDIGQKTKDERIWTLDLEPLDLFPTNPTGTTYDRQTTSPAGAVSQQSDLSAPKGRSLKEHSD